MDMSADFDLHRLYVRRCLVFLFLLSAIVMAIGVKLWYTRLQRYQDIIVKDEAEKYMRVPTVLPSDNTESSV